MEMELIIVQFKDARGREWQAAGELASIVVPVGGGDERMELKDLEALGEIQLTGVKVVRP